VNLPEVGTVLFYVCSVLAVFCAARVVSTRDIFHAAYYLAATLLLVAVIYLLMHAEFVAVVQVLVYVGAVAVLLAFAVMLTAKISDHRETQTNRLAVPAALAAAALFAALLKAVVGAGWEPSGAVSAQAAGSQANLQAIGMALFKDHLYPFELAGLALFTALIGAVLIARKDPE
jgi:NADH-quinone oxidoreductase subunit J